MKTKQICEILTCLDFFAKNLRHAQLVQAMPLYTSGFIMATGIRVTTA